MMNYDIRMGRSLPVPRKNLGVKGGAGGGLALATNLDPSGSLPVRHPHKTARPQETSRRGKREKK